MKKVGRSFWTRYVPETLKLVSSGIPQCSDGEAQQCKLERL